jgi:cell filamentation protein, protein adenylyltransferase
MHPPYRITNNILKLVAAISEKIGEINSLHLYKPPTLLRRKNKIKSIQSSLEIEGNTMTLDQVTALIDKKRVVAPHRDVLEVKNAIEVYDNLDKYDTCNLSSLLEAHKILMKGLVENPGKFRTGAVGIARGEEITHISPAGGMVNGLVKDLFRYLRYDEDLTLIKSCVFHYEFEFIHPFVNGNGRMGRLWQTLILRKNSPVYEFLPIESLIKERQMEYYSVLSKADSQGESTLFIEFMMDIIHNSLEDLLRSQNISLTREERIDLYKDTVGADYFSRKDYLRNNKSISPATASRDLKYAVENRILVIKGDKRTAQYRYC